MKNEANDGETVVTSALVDLARRRRIKLPGVTVWLDGAATPSIRSGRSSLNTTRFSLRILNAGMVMKAAARSVPSKRVALPERRHFHSGFVELRGEGAHGRLFAVGLGTCAWRSFAPATR